jgi:hypothetical protein
MAKATSSLHAQVKDQHALMALFVALAVFFFSFNAAVQTERAAASVIEATTGAL